MIRSTAASISTREAGVIGSARNARTDEKKREAMASALRRLDDEVSLHLLVERRAEVRAVVAEDAGLVGLEGDDLGLARVDDDVDVVVEQAPAVQLVGRLLDVRERDLHRVSLVHLDR